MSNLRSDSAAVQQTTETLALESQQTARALGMVGYGLLAYQCGGVKRPLAVLRSYAGYYLGTLCEEGPFTRESEEYWSVRKDAEEALKSGIWTQRPHL